jgi:hypothetical protein
MKYTMWSSWLFLLTVLLIEKTHLTPLFDYASYFPAIILVALHFYNLKYCQCKNNNCCLN